MIRNKEILIRNKAKRFEKHTAVDCGPMLTLLYCLHATKAVEEEKKRATAAATLIYGS